MFPTIHDYKSYDFASQGYGALSDCVSCVVTEELNGAYTLEMKYPLDGHLAKYLTPGNIIVAKPNHIHQRQPFRIHQIKRSFANNITVYANHICYDMSGYSLRNARTYNSLADVITAINGFDWSDQGVPYHSFTFNTDMTSSKTFHMPGIQTLRSWMGGQEGSILDTYGGEWEYDGFSCFLASRRGRDTGYRISYGKNLAEYEKQKEYNEYSHICAFWQTSDNYNYGNLVATGLSCPFRVMYYDASNMFDSQPTTAQLDAVAQTALSALSFDAQTITITPAQLGNNLIGLGDSVLICYELVFKTRVIKTVWNVLADAYDQLQLGIKKETITDTIKSLGSGQTTIYSGGGGGSTITVDSALSTTSTNPVENRVITNSLNTKVTSETGKGLSTNDFTTTEKNKLSGIASGAEVNVQSDWSVSDSSSDAFIKNKPTIPSAASSTPSMDGTGAVGSSSNYARADHVHPSDTSRVPTTRTVNGKALSANIEITSDDIDIDGTSLSHWIEDMYNDIESKANKESPTFTGTPKAPTAAAGTSTTQLATTEFVQTAVAGASVTGADYIVEENVGEASGYTKWNSGKMETWQRQTLNVNITSAMAGNLYYGTISAISYPQTFTNYPVVDITAQVSQGFGWIIPTYDNYAKGNTGTLYIYYPVSKSNVPVTINIKAVGKWK